MRNQNKKTASFKKAVFFYMEMGYMEIYDIFDEAIKMKASDIHLTNNSYPVFRKDGELFLIKYFPIMTENLIKKYYMNLY